MIPEISAPIPEPLFGFSISGTVEPTINAKAKTETNIIDNSKLAIIFLLSIFIPPRYKINNYTN